MRKRLLSILTALALCLSLLPAAAMAEEHICAEGEEIDHCCDECWAALRDLCFDEDEDGWCDWYDCCYSHMACTDENNDHYCDLDECSATVSSCVDEIHDHWCDLCGELTYRIDTLENGDRVCSGEACSAHETFIGGTFTELMYRENDEGEIVADGEVEITVSLYKNSTTTPLNDGTVIVSWSDGDYDTVLDDFTVEESLEGEKITVSFTDLPADALNRGDLLYLPADDDSYLPSQNGLVLRYKDNAVMLNVDSNADVTINGVPENRLCLLEGTEVSVAVDSDAEGTLEVSFYGDEDFDKPEYEVTDTTVTFTMPDAEDVELTLSFTCKECVDEDEDHFCDACWELLSQCKDTDEDHCCDICWEYLPDLCTDGEDESIHYCDVCWERLNSLCEDEDENHLCDICDTLMDNVCYDENNDHFCDLEECGNQISWCDESDWDEDCVCDICGEGIYPHPQNLGVAAEAADGEITVIWNTLPDAGKDRVSVYIVYCHPEGNNEAAIFKEYNPEAESEEGTFSHTFTGLTNDTLYDAGVTAIYTEVEDGYDTPYSVSSSKLVRPVSADAVLPDAPSITSVTYGNKSITVEWMAPENDGGSKIFEYAIEVLDGDEASYRTYVEAEEGMPLRYTMDDLENGHTYTVYVSAVNGAGSGASDMESIEIPLMPYTLLIEGIAVTEENMEDVLEDGTVSYDPETYTLTLDNANISVTGGNYGIRSTTALNMILVGENKVTCSGVYGIHSTDDVIISGNGSLEVTAGDVGIYIAGGSEVGGLTLCEDVNLTVTSGNVSSGNSYGVRVDDVLEVKDNAVLTATGGTAPERSCGIYAYDEVNIYDNAVVTAVGANQSVDLNTDGDGIRTTHVTIYGGTVTAIGGTGATTNGIFTQTFDMYDGSLIAEAGSTSGGLRFGPSVALQATRSLNLWDGNITAISGAAGNDQSCGILVSNGTLYMEDGSITAEGGKANYSYGIKASNANISGGFVTATGSEGVWCSDGISVEGSLSISGGNVNAVATDAETYSYGIQAFEMDITGGEISAESGRAANSYGLWAFGEMKLSCDDLSLNPYGPGIIGTNIAAKSESGYGIYSRTGIEVNEVLTISAPEKGQVKGADIGELTEYYTILDSSDSAAKLVKINPLTYTVAITGLSYAMKVSVPAGWSVNETYCEKYNVEDFSEILNTEKPGYIFKGWFTDESYADSFTFAEKITEDVTLYPKWEKISSGGGSGGGSGIKTETTKNDDGSVTITTTNKKNGEITKTTKSAEGVTATIKTAKDGSVLEQSAKIPASAVKSDTAVTLPMEMKASADSEDAAKIHVDVPSSGAAVEIPVKNVTPGTVAVLVKADGTEEIMKTSTVTESGVVVRLERDAVLKIIENSKTFTDVHGVDHWAVDAIDFVTARGFSSGTGENTYTPNGSMTRQAMWMIMARMSGEDPANMTEAKDWAVETGISDGSNAVSSVTRQQFVTMLWRWAQTQNVDVSAGENTNVLSYEDALSISNYAMPAIQWACGEGVMSGYADGTLRPHNTATRAHAAKMLMNFLNQ